MNETAPETQPETRLFGRFLGPRSIRFHLAIVFLGFFSLIALLGFFSASLLSNFHLLSTDVAEVWLPHTRVLGDLNNFTSDFRAIEGSAILQSSQARDLAPVETEMRMLDQSIALAQGSFEKIRRDSYESSLYAIFRTNWAEYRSNVDRILTLAHTNRLQEAIALYTGASRAAYTAASEALARLTDQTVANAQAASDRLGDAYAKALWTIATCIAIAATMVAAAVFYVRRLISIPILQLADTMHRLALNETEVNIPGIERRDEIGEMARAAVVFRQNALQLVRSQASLAHQAALLQSQLDREKSVTALQRNFVAMASHEFRTPLTAIDGHARRLLNTAQALNREQVQERAGRIRAAVTRITHLIDNLLSSSRLYDTGNGIDYAPRACDLVQILRDVCQSYREIYPAATIDEHYACVSIPITGDPALLAQVFGNLIANAIKYSPDAPLVEVCATIRDHQALVDMRDHGIGIPAKDLDHVFERYSRGSNVYGVVGTGIGLYLVKTVVDLHGGTVSAESQEGKGSIFSVRLACADHVAQ